MVAAIGVLAVPLGGASAEEVCGEAVTLSGDAALTDSIGDVLALRDIGAEASGDCPSTTVVVTEVSTGLLVGAAFADGSTASALVSDVATAATVIEGWVRADVDGAFLAELERPLDVPAPAAAVASAPPPAASPLPTEHATASSDRGGERLSLAGAVQLSASVGADGSLWVNPEANAAVPLGRIRVGTRMRGRFDTRRFGDSVPLDTWRRGMDVLVTASLPISLDAAVLSPGIGVGAGWLHEVFQGDEVPRGSVAVDAGGPRLEVRLDGAGPLATLNAADVGLFWTWSPAAHTATFVEDGVTLAGEPQWAVGLAVGLHLGAL
ncbi:MAG: hypothetical protein KC619_09900 [Myxococcales bacterium]|nr:hypothetical protein [Myxococcales bacterium]